MTFKVHYSRLLSGSPLVLEVEADSPELAINEFIRRCRASGNRADEMGPGKKPSWGKRMVLRTYLMNSLVLYVGCHENPTG